MGTFFMVVAVIISLLLMLIGFSWVSEKLFGVKPLSSYSRLHKANEQAAKDKKLLEELSIINPTGVKEAIDRCKQKGYARTHTNVLAEYRN